MIKRWLRRVLCRMGFHSHYVLRLPLIEGASVVYSVAYCWHCRYAKRFPQTISGYQPLSSLRTPNPPPRKP